MNTKNLLLAILLVFVFAVGFMVGRFSSVGNSYISDLASESSTMNTTSENGDTDTTEGTTIETSSLSEVQLKLLNALGIEASSINVTPEMVACAEASLGSTRIEEIINGATPSFSEGLKLANCYR